MTSKLQVDVPNLSPNDPSDTRPTPSDTNPPWGSEIHGWREKDIETPLDSMGTYNIYIYMHIYKNDCQ